MVLVFDHLSAPFHHHQHDSGVDAVSVALAEAAVSHSSAADAETADSHADDHDADGDHGDKRLGHSATALRTQGLPDLSGVHALGGALIVATAFVIVFPAVEIDVPAPEWPDRGPPLFTYFKSLPPAGRAPPLHA